MDSGHMIQCIETMEVSGKLHEGIDVVFFECSHKASVFIIFQHFQLFLCEKLKAVLQIELFWMVLHLELQKRLIKGDIQLDEVFFLLREGSLSGILIHQQHHIIIDCSQIHGNGVFRRKGFLQQCKEGCSMVLFFRQKPLESCNELLVF